MNDSIKKKILQTMFGGLICLFALAAASFAQADKILVGGNPPLTQTDADKSREVFEWMFDARFSAAERAEYQKHLIAAWKLDRRSLSKMVGEFANLYDKLQAATDAGQKEKVRRMMASETVAEMEKDAGGNADSDLIQMLLGIYRSAREGGGADTRNEDRAQNSNATRRDDNRSARSDDNPATTRDERAGAGSPRDLIGEWNIGGAISGDYVNRQTGEILNSAGRMLTYKFFADGRVEMSGLLETRLAGMCAFTTFALQKGRATVVGNELKLDFTDVKNSVKSECNPSQNYTNRTYPAESETYKWRITRDDDGATLLELTDAKGSVLSLVKNGK